MHHAGWTRVASDQPALYCIELQGHLDPSWAEEVSGLAITVAQPERGPAITTLTGLVADQAAMMGVLNLAYSLGLPLLSVRCLGRPT